MTSPVRRGRRNWLRAAMCALAAVTAMAVLTGCTTQKVAGQPVAFGGIDTVTVGGLPIVDGPSGPKAGVANANLPVENTDHGEIDALAVNAVVDLQEYWTEHFQTDFNTRFVPISKLASWDSRSNKGVVLCQMDTKGQINAFYCSIDDVIAWDRGQLLPMIIKQFGEMAVVAVLAHEFGHAVQYRLAAAGSVTGLPEEALVNRNSPSIMLEQQADCYTGAFFRHVAEGGSKYFELSTGEGLNKAMATLFSIRDRVGSDFRSEQAHGSAFDRTAAFQIGFIEGPKRCASMSMKDIEPRLTEFAFKKKQDTGKGDLPVTADTVKVIEESLNAVFEDTGAQPPAVQTTPVQCPDGGNTEPVAYCPSTNTVSMDLEELARIATPPTPEGPFDVPPDFETGIGDFAAFGEIASRYVLSVQKAIGLELSGETAGLRTACLVGAWAGLLVEHPLNKRNPVGSLRISPGDMDEAVAELLTNRSLIAADVNGNAVKSGFARVDALRMGFIEGAAPCTQKFE